MSLFAWSWVLCVVQVTGIFLTGHNLRWGWGFGIGAQLCVWIPYGLSTGQPGTAVGSSIFVGVLSWNLYRWRRSAVTASAAAVGPAAVVAAGPSLLVRMAGAAARALVADGREPRPRRSSLWATRPGRGSV